MDEDLTDTLGDQDASVVVLRDDSPRQQHNA
jgi:hypothetical protein